mgnify:CR=1 FL=1
MIKFQLKQNNTKLKTQLKFTWFNLRILHMILINQRIWVGRNMNNNQNKKWKFIKNNIYYNIQKIHKMSNPKIYFLYQLHKFKIGFKTLIKN